MKRLVGAEYWHRFVKVLGVGYTFDKAQQQMDMSSSCPSVLLPSCPRHDLHRLQVLQQEESEGATSHSVITE